MNKFILALIIISSAFSTSCTKDTEDEIIDKPLNNIDTKFVIDFTKTDAESKDTFFINYYFESQNKSVFDTVVNQTSWESPVVKSNSNDSTYCKVTAKSYSLKSDNFPSLDISFKAVDKSINVYIYSSYSGTNSRSFYVLDGITTATINAKTTARWYFKK